MIITTTATASTSSISLLDKHRIHLKKELGSEEAVDIAYRHGARSITAQEALGNGFRVIGIDGRQQSSGGILFPFSNDFAQLRCDEQPISRRGQNCKYLTRCGYKFQLKVFGDGDPIIATEGWKDALRIHMETGKSTVALPSISGWKLIPTTVRHIIYDADASHNPHVWGQLIRGGMRLQSAEIGFFPREVAGNKGGACEFFNNGGEWKQLNFSRPRHLVREIWKNWTKLDRADFTRANIRTLIRSADELGFDQIDTELLLKQASQKVGVSKKQVKELQLRYAKANKAVDAPSEEPDDTHSRVQEINIQIGKYWCADYDHSQAWFFWTGKQWKHLIGNDYINRALEEVYDSLGWKKRRAEVVGSDRAGIRRAVGNQLPNLSIGNGLVPFLNGMLRMKDMTLLDHSPDYGNRHCLPYLWQGPNAPCDKFNAFMMDRLEDEDTVALFNAFCYCLLTGMKAKVILEIVGASDTGKSVVVNCLQALVGDENCVSGSLARLESPGNRFESLRYRDARLALFPEAQNYSGPLEVIKAMSGRDTIPAERKSSTAQVDFVFDGAIVIAGNKPIRVSDTSSAVHNRRRGIHINKVVPPSEQRPMLEWSNGEWIGELADQLPGFAANVLAMGGASAQKALRRDVKSINRAKADLRSLRESDHLARWADECLVWDEQIEYSRIGKVEGDPNDGWLLPHYRQWVAEHENFKPHGQSNFKNKLLTILRDSLEVQLPPDGDPSYKVRNVGSVIPNVRLRSRSDGDAMGIIEWAALKRVGGLGEQSKNIEVPLSNDWNGRNEPHQWEQVKLGPTRNNPLSKQCKTQLGGGTRQSTVHIVPSVLQ